MSTEISGRGRAAASVRSRLWTLTPRPGVVLEQPSPLSLKSFKTPCLSRGPCKSHPQKLSGSCEVSSYISRFVISFVIKYIRTMAQLILALLAILLAVVNADGLYTKNSPVLQINAKNYDRLIAKSNHTSVRKSVRRQISYTDYL